MSFHPPEAQQNFCPKRKAFCLEPGTVWVTSGQTALERALTNLVQNAIDHGGRQGTMTVRVDENGFVEVCDEGNRFTRGERGQIFEPFNHLASERRGAGLRLNLVREIVQPHDGCIAVVNLAPKGTCLRMSSPANRIVNCNTRTS